MDFLDFMWNFPQECTFALLVHIDGLQFQWCNSYSLIFYQLNVILVTNNKTKTQLIEITREITKDVEINVIALYNQMVFFV